MGKVAIVTGAGSGIGAALAAAMVRRGDTVVLADQDEGAVRQVCAGLSGLPGSARPVPLDVRDAAAVAATVTGTQQEYGRLDVMVNNAGIGMRGELQDLTEEHWNRIIDVNVRGVVHGVMAAYPLMLEQGHGHLVNTASLAGLCPSPLLTPYATTKHAIVGLSLSLRAEAAVRGVTVTVVCPGPVDTPFLDKGGPADLPRTRIRQHLDVRAMIEENGRAYSADDLAADILKGMARGRAIVVAPRAARLTWLANRYVPRLVDRVVQRGARDVLRRLDAAVAGQHAGDPVDAPARSAASDPATTA